MKWKTCVFAVLAGSSLILGAPSLGTAESGTSAIVGGFVPAGVKDKQVKAAAVAAVKTETLVLHEDRVTRNSKLKLVSVLAAEQQVVAGVNYRLQLRVKLDGKEREAEAVVWWQPWRKPEPYRLTSWSWK